MSASNGRFSHPQQMEETQLAEMLQT